MRVYFGTKFLSLDIKPMVPLIFTAFYNKLISNVTSQKLDWNNKLVTLNPLMATFSTLSLPAAKGVYRLEEIVT